MSSPCPIFPSIVLTVSLFYPLLKWFGNKDSQKESYILKASLFSTLYYNGLVTRTAEGMSPEIKAERRKFNTVSDTDLNNKLEQKDQVTTDLIAIKL